MIRLDMLKMADMRRGGECPPPKGLKIDTKPKTLLKLSVKLY